jgi:sugar phosphate isomerase/epimerase
MADIEDLVINTITNAPLSLESAVSLYARQGVRSITPWFDKIEEVGLNQARTLIKDAGLEVSAMCLAGLFSNEGREQRTHAIDQSRRRLDMAAELGAEVMVTVPGGLFPESRDLAEASDYNFDAMAELLEHARSVGVILGLEALHPMYCPDWSVVTRLSVANDWCDRLGEGMGVIVDAYHTWWDPDLKPEIMRAGKAGRIVAYHVNDWRVPTRDILNDRALMGDGVIDLPMLTSIMREAGYTGKIEVEIFSDEWWEKDPDLYLTEIKDRFVTSV